MAMEQPGMRTHVKGRIKFTLGILEALVVAAIAAPAPAIAAGSETVWRAYNRYSGEHLFTTDRAEYDRVGRAGWQLEGEGWQAPITGDPVYRLNNPYSGEHHYTTDRTEYDRLGQQGWIQEDVAFRSAPSTGKPVYRLFNPYVSVGTHHYTTEIDEYADLGSRRNGWRQERTGWYGLGTPEELGSNWKVVEGVLHFEYRDYPGGTLFDPDPYLYFAREESFYFYVNADHRRTISTDMFALFDSDLRDYPDGATLRVAIDQDMIDFSEASFITCGWFSEGIAIL